jgi:hypothetical protein
MPVCHQCGQDNPDQPFCGQCGSALALKDYISEKVKEQLSARDKSIAETDSAIKVFERALGWMKTVAWIVAIPLVIFGALGIWKVSDFWSAVNSAERSVNDLSTSAKGQMQSAAQKATSDVQATVTQSRQTMASNLAEVKKESAGLHSTIIGMRQEATAITSNIDSAKTQLKSAESLKPQMEEMQKSLAGALVQVQKQQETISSSEAFVKDVFSSHRTNTFTVLAGTGPQVASIPAGPSGGNSVILLLLPDAPIPQTLQLQFKVFTQPANSYVTIHNLVIFFWGDPIGNIIGQQLTASYFPDKSDKEHISALSEKDGRIYADGEPLPYFNKADPDYKGNKWIKNGDEPKKQ